MTKVEDRESSKWRKAKGAFSDFGFGASFGFRHSSFSRHSSFVIRYWRLLLRPWCCQPWFLILGTSIFQAPASDQAQWGQAWSRNMVSDEKGLPDPFDPTTGRNIKWVAQLGTETHSTPVVAGGRVYIGTNNGEPRDARHQGDRGALVCLEAQTGRLLWQRDAAHSSILIHGDYLYLNTGTGVDNTHQRIRAPDAPSLVVLDKRSGRLVARDYEHIAPDIFHCTWSAPSLGEVNGRPLIFFAGGNGVIYAFEAIDPPLAPPGRGTGDDASSEATPLPGGVGGGYGGAAGRTKTLKKVFKFDFDPTAPKENIHQYLSNRRDGPSNFYGMPVFYRNRIYLAGGGDVFWGKNEAWLKCIDATKTGDITTNGLVWTYPLQKHVLSTPAIYDGLVFIADCGRAFHCLDAETG